VGNAFCDAATAGGNLGVRGPRHPPFVLIEPVLREHQVSVAVDEAGEHHLTLRADRTAIRSRLHRAQDFVTRARCHNTARMSRECSIFHDADVAERLAGARFPVTAHGDKLADVGDDEIRVERRHDVFASSLSSMGI